MLTQHDCKNELNEAQLRATPARLAVMKLLETSSQPVDVQTMISYLHEQNIPTDPATVFRIVHLFTEKGLTKPIQLQEGKFRYELTGKVDHHHLVCTKCDRIEDIADCHIVSFEREIAKKKQFQVTSHALEFFGLCSKCQKVN
jgi:Fur family ferric uptake transcriptional regulator